MMLQKSSFTWRDFLLACAAVLIGAGVNYAGDRLLNVRLEIYHGISTFSPVWVLDLVLVPFISGLVVAAVYGLGAKIVANFAPMVVRIASFVTVDGSTLPDGVSVLPIGFWILLTIVAVEAAAGGGFVGEIFIKKTYGRRAKHLVHKRFRDADDDDEAADPASSKGVEK